MTHERRKAVNSTAPMGSPHPLVLLRPQLAWSSGCPHVPAAPGFPAHRHGCQLLPDSFGAPEEQTPCFPPERALEEPGGPRGYSSDHTAQAPCP